MTPSLPLYLDIICGCSLTRVDFSRVYSDKENVRKKNPIQAINVDKKLSARGEQTDNNNDGSHIFYGLGFDVIVPNIFKTE